MSKLEKLTELKQRVERARETAAKLRGRLERVEEEIRKGYDCSPEEAVVLLKKLKNQAKSLRSRYEQGVEELETKWKAHL
jgi:chromosome segregation ATPase